MAHRLKDASGNCCGCRDLAARCQCAKCEGDTLLYLEVPNAPGWETRVVDLRLKFAGTPLVLECQALGGTVELCGHSEFVASTPPRKYLRMTGSGTLSYHCSDGTTTSFDRSGSIVFSPVPTCASTGSISGPGVGAQCGVTVGSATATTRTASGNGTPCEAVGIFGCPSGGGRTYTVTGTVADTLSEEDTEEAAAARLLAGAAWGAWVESITSASACAAIWGVRTTGFSFPFRAVRWRVAPTSAGAGCVLAVATYERRPWTGGDWVAWGEEEVEIRFVAGAGAQMYRP